MRAGNVPRFIGNAGIHIDQDSLAAFEQIADRLGVNGRDAWRGSHQFPAFRPCLDLALKCVL